MARMFVGGLAGNLDYYGVPALKAALVQLASRPEVDAVPGGMWLARGPDRVDHQPAGGGAASLGFEEAVFEAEQACPDAERGSHDAGRAHLPGVPRSAGLALRVVLRHWTAAFTVAPA
jgi:hypothetical protein